MASKAWLTGGCRSQTRASAGFGRPGSRWRCSTAAACSSACSKWPFRHSPLTSRWSKSCSRKLAGAGTKRLAWPGQSPTGTRRSFSRATTPKSTYLAHVASQALPTSSTGSVMLGKPAQACGSSLSSCRACSSRSSARSRGRDSAGAVSGRKARSASQATRTIAGRGSMPVSTPASLTHAIFWVRSRFTRRLAASSCRQSAIQGGQDLASARAIVARSTWPTSK